MSGDFNTMLPMRNLFFTFLLAFCAVLPVCVQAADAAKPLVAVLLCEEGDEVEHYDAYNNMPPFVEQLAGENNWDTAIIKSKEYAAMPSLDVLEKADTFIIYVRRIALPEKEMDKLQKYVNESGKGLLCIRTACHGFSVNGKIPAGCKDWKEFDKLILGGNYHGHGRNEIGGEVWNVNEQAKSAILKDVKPSVWHSAASVYFNTPLKEDCTVYQYTGSTEQGKMPLTWTRIHNKTRIAYTALGYKTEFNHPAFKTLVRNLILWTLEKK
ncbi:MAG: ThuA domain-containing protein [Planctomycetaceae bacterium]|nr:ThuA domain-containing protein [Planctomycetaceae bacterium]